MKCVLAALGFINEDIEHNKQVLLQAMQKCANQADILLFGESFLQGFYGATFDVAHDEKIALTLNDRTIQEICLAAANYHISISFGFIEKADGCFYSSQLTIDQNGHILDLYRRVSSGWKESFAGKEYREGKEFHTFSYLNKTIAVALCGDLWFDENVDAIKRLSPDLVFWPVYTDYNYNEWNNSVKYEYAEQAGKVGCDVLYVNSVCKDKEAYDIARGGAALFAHGKIKQELSSKQEGLLFIEV